MYVLFATEKWLVFRFSSLRAHLLSQPALDVALLAGQLHAHTHHRLAQVPPRLVVTPTAYLLQRHLRRLVHLELQNVHPTRRLHGAVHAPIGRAHLAVRANAQVAKQQVNRRMVKPL
ncbi:MAG: hypothetical protein NZM43_03935, partial [Saprospiraceae bacterium]|nr:hypothetical protein [Saprospiraceae bacterium]MDW8483456.1 hypothetical protein [Saprospiraceae bacterium]